MENHISVSELCKLIARNNVGDCVQVTAIDTKEELPESFGGTSIRDNDFSCVEDVVLTISYKRKRVLIAAAIL